MITQWIFTVIVAAVIAQRLVELRISRRNAKYILAQGGKEHGDNLLGLVKVLQISWFLSMLAEVWLLNRPFIPILAFIGILGVVAGQTLRFLSMQALEWRWTLPIMTVPGMPAVDTGIYRYLRHPSWFGVILEIASLPLIHGAYLTAVFFSSLNLLVIVKRIKEEEKILNPL
jgi:methyltransferase